MKFFIALIVFYGLNISGAGYPINPSSATEISEENAQKQFTQTNFPLNRLDSDARNRYPFQYRQTRAYLKYGRGYRANQRVLNPHRYLYANGRRNYIPSFHQRLLAVNNRDNPQTAIYRHGLPQKRSRLSKYNSGAVRNSFVRPFMTQTRHNRNSNVFNVSNFRLNSSPQKRGIDKPFLPKSKNSGKIADPIDSLTSANASKEEFANKTSILKSGSQLKVNKRDLIREKTTSARVKRLYERLSRFDLLYIFGLFLIFIPIASFAVVILPVTSFCWSTCKKRKRRGGKSNPSSKDVRIEAALASDPPEDPKHPTNSKSTEDIYKNFVSNEIDGDGDTVAKRMKLERWITQDFAPKAKSRSKHHKLFTSADMESVAEEPSDVESACGSATQYDVSEAENEGPNRRQDDIPDISEYQRSKKSRMKGDKKASKQESHPFDFPDKRLAVERAHNDKMTNPRQIYSIFNQPKRIPKRSSISMIDIKPEHLQRM